VVLLIGDKMAELSYSGSDKDQFVTALAALVVADAGVDVTADNINAVINGSGNSVAAYWAPMFAASIEKAGSIDKFFGAPGAAPAGGAGKF
jgi:ribosomal protein L12E/L44/L45/RPP1/RPP2